jgi:DNA polymerase
MYHPAAALHQASLKPIVDADFARLPELIAKAREVSEYKEEAPVEKNEPKQLSLF